MRVRAIDISGQRFGRLVVLERAPRGERKNRRAIWVCQCDCGSRCEVGADGLRSGHTNSCGCLSKDTAKMTHTKHGHTSDFSVSREYSAWANMRARCSGRQRKCWKNYGGRGITVCPEWDQSFEKFLRHVGRSPGRGYELDRIDNDKGYQPGNVRWVTKSENNRNRRSRQRIQEDNHVS